MTVLAAKSGPKQSVAIIKRILTTFIQWWQHLTELDPLKLRQDDHSLNMEDLADDVDHESWQHRCLWCPPNLRLPRTG